MGRKQKTERIRTLSAILLIDEYRPSTIITADMMICTQNPKHQSDDEGRKRTKSTRRNHTHHKNTSQKHRQSTPTGPIPRIRSPISGRSFRSVIVQPEDAGEAVCEPDGEDGGDHGEEVGEELVFVGVIVSISQQPS